MTSTDTDNAPRKSWVRRHRRFAALALLAGMLPVGALAYLIAVSTGTATFTSPGAITSAGPPPVALVIADKTVSYVSTHGAGTAGFNGTGAAQPADCTTGAQSASGTCWTFGTSYQYELSITNPSTYNVGQINGLVLTGWSTTNANCNSSISALAGTFTATSAVVNSTLGAGDTTGPYALTVTMNNLSGADQTACVGATPSFAFATN